MDKNQTNNIWRLLKKGGYWDIPSLITAGATGDKKEIGAFLDGLVKKGFLERGGAGNQYKIRIVLDRPLGSERLGVYKYEKLTKLDTAAIPRAWDNPNIGKLMWRDQGDRGICVGVSAANGIDLDIIAVLGRIPTEEEKMKYVKKDVRTNIGSCTILHDTGYPENSTSGQCIYVWSRELGHVTDPVGSYVSAAAEALTKRGVCLEREWFTPKSVYCAPDYPYPETDMVKIIQSAARKMWNGYSNSTDFETICKGIYEHGYVLGPIDIYSNYLQDNAQGMLPDPRGESIGSHALCWTGYDLDKKELHCVMTWGSAWTYTSGISYRYFMSGAGAFYIPLSVKQLEDAHELYRRVVISSVDDKKFPVSCTYEVMGGETTKGTSVTISLVDGHYTLKATPLTLNKYKEAYIAKEFDVTKDTEVTFTFTQYSIRDRIMELLKKLRFWR
jgi:hypothetical protein